MAELAEAQVVIKSKLEVDDSVDHTHLDCSLSQICHSFLDRMVQFPSHFDPQGQQHNIV